MSAEDGTGHVGQVTSQQVDDAVGKAVLQVLVPRSIADIDFTSCVSAGTAGELQHLHAHDCRTAGRARRIEWVPVPELRRLVRNGEMLDGLSVTGVCYALAFGELD